jgi:hypothetical protein
MNANAEVNVKSLIVFALLIVGPLFYLWEHACSFRLCEQIGRLQEERQRLTEVCDSLNATAVNWSSKYRIETQATVLGLGPEFALGPKPQRPGRFLAALSVAASSSLRGRMTGAKALTGTKKSG